MKKKKQILDRIRKLVKLYDSGKIEKLHSHEVNPGLDKSSRLNYIYFTLPVSINYQRSSPAMWQSALKTFEDKETNDVFYPEKVVKLTKDQLMKKLIKHKLALQKNKHTEIWKKLSKTFNQHFKNDPRIMLKQIDYDIEKLLLLLQKEMKKDFPYLSGPKLSNYWPFILLHYTDVRFKNKKKISIIPDTHIMKTSIKLGISSEKDDSQVVSEKWHQLLERTEFAPVDLHSIFWNWSKAGFKPNV